MFLSLLNHVLHKLATILADGYSIPPLLHRMRVAKIGTNAWISQYVHLDDANPENISIGDNCTIGLPAARSRANN